MARRLKSRNSQNRSSSQDATISTAGEGEIESGGGKLPVSQSLPYIADGAAAGSSFMTEFKLDLEDSDNSGRNAIIIDTDGNDILIYNAEPVTNSTLDVADAVGDSNAKTAGGDSNNCKTTYITLDPKSCESARSTTKHTLKKEPSPPTLSLSHSFSNSNNSSKKIKIFFRNENNNSSMYSSRII